MLYLQARLAIWMDIEYLTPNVSTWHCAEGDNSGYMRVYVDVAVLK